MVHIKLVIRVVFGIIGNFLSFGVFVSPAPTFYKVIKKNNSVAEELKPEYYLLATMNCLFWVVYSLPFVQPGSILVLTANAIGVAINLGYVLIFLLYATDNKQRMYVGCIFLIELAVFGLITGLVIGLAHTMLARMAIIGGFCYLFSIMMNMPRGIPWVPVCMKKSVEDLPPYPVVLTNTLNDLCWLIYASIRFDIFLWSTYFVGLSFGVVQLILHSVYNNSTSKVGDYNKLGTTEVQLGGTGVDDDHKKLDEVQMQAQLQKMDTCDDNKVATSEVQLQSIVTVV